MKHRLIITFGLSTLVCAVVAATALGGGKGRLYQFRGEVGSASQTSVAVTVEGGNHAALKALIGQAQTESFTLGSRSEVLVYSHGVPHVGSAAELHPGDNVTVNVRAHGGASLAELLATPLATIGDHGAHRGEPGSTRFLSSCSTPSAPAHDPGRAHSPFSGNSS